MNRIRVLLTTFMLLSMWPAASFAQQDVSSQPLSSLERAALFPTRNQIEEGRKLAETNCSACHGMGGITEKSEIPNLASQRTVYLYRQLQNFRKQVRGAPEMHLNVQFLDDAVLLKAAIYYASLEYPRKDAAPEPAWMTDDDPLRAVRAATAGCGSCHGADGNSRVPGMPSLTAQHPDYFIAAMKDYQAGARKHSMMQMLVSTLQDEKIRDMGLFYALQEPAASPTGVSGDPETGRVAAEPCASCHGADGNASAPDMPSLAGQDAKYLVASMQSYLDGDRDHEPMRQAMKGANTTIINDMAAYYAAQAPLARQVRKPLTTSQWLERCERCHGVRGDSPNPRYPSLAGQNASYLSRTMQTYAGGERSNRIMHAMSEPLSNTDIQRLSEYFASQVPRRAIYLDLPCEKREESQ